jgi:hypothetical protein
MLYRTKDSMSDLVIADFGLSKIMNQSKFEGLMTTCGTPVIGNIIGNTFILKLNNDIANFY